jgi:hypothetical protein
MPSNPYQPPGTEKSFDAPHRSKRTCLLGLATAIVAFAGVFVLVALKPIDTGDPEPPNVAVTRRLMAGLILLLWLVTFAGLIVAILGGIAWASSRRN